MALLLRLLVLCVVAQPLAAQSWRLLIPVQAYTVQINHLDPNKLYIGNWSNQMYRSEDGGKTWEILELGSTSSESYVTSLIASKADTNVLLAGGFLFTGMKRSVDGGQTWEQTLIDPALRRMWFVSEAIIEDPQEPSTIYAARCSIFNSIWKSTDIGATWDSIGVIDNSITGRLCTIGIRPDSTNILFVGAQGGVIMRSDDSGVNWYQVPVLDTAMFIREDSEIPKIVFSPRDPQVGYAVVAIASEVNIENNGGVLKTTNGGASWFRTGFSDTSFWAVDVRSAPGDGNDEVFLGGFRISRAPVDVKGDSLIYRSMDGGATWEELMNITWQPNELEDTIRNVWVIRYDPVGEKVYMATQVGLYVLDENTSVTDTDPLASATLSVTSTATALHITDHKPLATDRRWEIYGMDGTRILSGSIGTPGSTQIDIGSLSSGRYLLTWGSAQTLRTALFSVMR